uniref:Secreted protein n=1 Tax=Cyanoderma ruficeps TaxID=181631 RepID=A0A8C3NVC0_9PASS
MGCIISSSILCLHLQFIEVTFLKVQGTRCPYLPVLTVHNEQRYYGARNVTEGVGDPPIGARVCIRRLHPQHKRSYRKILCNSRLVDAFAEHGRVVVGICHVDANLDSPRPRGVPTVHRCQHKLKGALLLPVQRSLQD